MADGRVAAAPIALVEAQAYAVEAARGAAVLLAAIGTDADHERAGELTAFAEEHAERIRERFWVEDEGTGRYLAMALDGEGEAWVLLHADGLWLAEGRYA